MPGRDGIPSVTEILSDVGLGWQGYAGLSADRLTFLRARGKATHAALHWLATEGTLPTPLHPAIERPVAAYTRWAMDTDHVVLASELESIHSTKLYMGHLDRVGRVQDVLTLIDFKVTAAPDLLAAAYQLAGYHRLLTDALLTPVKCVVVALNPDTGDYRHHDLTDRVQDALHIFDAAVVVHHARVGRAR